MRAPIIDGAVRRANGMLRQAGVELYEAPPEALGYGTTQARTLRNAVLKGLARSGYGLRRTYAPDLEPHAIATVERVRPHTMTSQASIVGLCEAVQYIVRNEIPGAFVECGVWRGGSMMAAALTLLRLGAADRDLYLFDTFAGMTEPGSSDMSLTQPDEATHERWRLAGREGYNAWAYAPLEAVRENLVGTGYPAERVHLVKGAVEDTVPGSAPGEIALLRLDTDWYASTRHELEHLYPRLAPGGVLVLDDYGSWAGARQAADEYGPVAGLLLARLDAYARIAVKPRPA